MTIFLPPWPQVIDPSANFPVSGGKLNFFLSGTTTAVDVYSDSALTTSLGNAVTCDSNGRPETAIYLDPAYTYKIIVTDSGGDTGSPLYPVIDPYDPAGKPSAPVSDISGSSNTYTAAYAGKLARRTHSAAMSDVLPTAATAGAGFFLHLKNATSAYNLTVTVASAGTIDGASSLVIYPGQQRVLRSTGSAWITDPAEIYAGKHVYSLPAAAWKETANNGCAPIAVGETGTNKVNYDYLAFDDTTNEYAYCQFGLPASYLAGSLEFRVRWTAIGGTLAQTCIWGLAALCRTDGDGIDLAFGTAATVSDAYVTSLDLRETAWTAVTPAADAADRLMFLRLYRDAATDTMAGDARLLSVELRWVTAKPTDA